MRRQAGAGGGGAKGISIFALFFRRATGFRRSFSLITKKSYTAQQQRPERRSFTQGRQQFGYNEFGNERVGLQRRNAVKRKPAAAQGKCVAAKEPNGSAPTAVTASTLEPPCPVKEGILIDISPMNGDAASVPISSSFCILDAPIDVPTNCEDCVTQANAMK